MAAATVEFYSGVVCVSCCSCSRDRRSRPQTVSTPLLRIVENQFCSRFVRFNSSVHVLDLNGLLSKLRGEICHSSLQLLHFAMLLEKLVKQHRVNLVVAYRVDFA